MALTKSITWNSFDIPTAYARIEGINAIKQATDIFKVNINMNTYKDDTKEVCLEGKNYSVDIAYNGGNISLADVYKAIKETGVFEGWADLI